MLCVSKIVFLYYRSKNLMTAQLFPEKLITRGFQEFSRSLEKKSLGTHRGLDLCNTVSSSLPRAYESKFDISMHVYIKKTVGRYRKFNSSARVTAKEKERKERGSMTPALIFSDLFLSRRRRSTATRLDKYNKGSSAIFRKVRRRQRRRQRASSDTWKRPKKERAARTTSSVIIVTGDGKTFTTNEARS